MLPQLDDVDRRLLNRIQNDFPLDRRPYRVLGDWLGTGEDEVLARLRTLREAAVVRQISAIFDTRALGYRSTLVAMKFPPERLDEGAGIVGRHPGVSHNYARSHAFNLWFTLAVPPGQDLEAAVQRLGAEAGCVGTMILPTLRLFKIGVRLDVAGEREDETARETAEVYSGRDVTRGLALGLTPFDIEVVRQLQRDLPLEPEPFAAEAEALGIGVDELFARARELQQRGQMRRFAAVLRHQNAGFVANAMGVWTVPADRVDEVGPVMASFAAVSHCYERPTYPGWPYNLYTMVHSTTRDGCLRILQAIEERTGVHERQFLWSSREYKKERVQYFLEEPQPTAGAH